MCAEQKATRVRRHGGGSELTRVLLFSFSLFFFPLLVFPIFFFIVFFLPSLFLILLYYRFSKQPRVSQ